MSGISLSNISPPSVGTPNSTGTPNSGGISLANINPPGVASPNQTNNQPISQSTDQSPFKGGVNPFNTNPYTQNETMDVQPTQGTQNFGDYVGNSIDQAKTFLSDPIAGTENAIGTGIQTGLNIGQKNAQDILQLFQGAKTRTLPEGLALGANLASDVVNTVLSPLSIASSVAEQVPGLKQANDLINLPFSALGSAGSWSADKFVNVLPIDQQSKDTLRPAFEQVGSTGAQLILGAKAVEMIGKGLPVNEDSISKAVDEAKLTSDMIQSKTTTPETQTPQGIDLSNINAPGVQPKTETTQPVKPALETPPKENPISTDHFGKNVIPNKRGTPTSTAQSINDTFVKQGYDSLPKEEQSKYTPESYRAINDSITNLMNNDIETAKSMASGEMKLSRNMGNGTLLLKTMEKYATENGDGSLLLRLARSPLGKVLSKSGQALGESGYLSQSGQADAVGAIKQINDALSARSEKTNPETAPKGILKDLSDATDKAVKEGINIDSISKFIQENLC